MRLSEHRISSSVEFLLSLRSSVPLSSLDLVLAAANKAARDISAAQTGEEVHLAKLVGSFDLASFRADNSLSSSHTHTVVPSGVMSTDESSASGTESRTKVLWAESILILASSASIILARWHLAFSILESFEGSMLLGARTVESSATWNGVLDFHESWFFPSSLGWGCRGLLNHHNWGWGHHHLCNLLLFKI